MEGKNIFQMLGEPLREVPEDLKEKVMADVENVKLVFDIGKLVLNEYPKAATKIFTSEKNKSS